MGTLRTSFAWLIALSTVGLVSALPHVTLADDAGPGKEVRAIRHDLPALLQGRIWAQPRAFPINATDVAISGNTALVQWNDAVETRLAFMSRRYGTWWLEGDVYIQPDGSASGPGGYYSPADADGPTSELLGELDIPAALIAVAAQHLPIVVQADALARARGPRHFHGDGYEVQSLTFDSKAQEPFPLDGYQMRVVFASSTAPASATIAELSGRKPTEAESWTARGGNSYFFFSGTVKSDAPVHVDAGTTIDVWFPFVLDPSLHYALTIGFTDKPIGPLDGTLKDNVVHFTLPAFSVKPGAHLMAEVEGDPWPHYTPQ